MFECVCVCVCACTRKRETMTVCACVCHCFTDGVCVCVYYFKSKPVHAVEVLEPELLISRPPIVIFFPVICVRLHRSELCSSD